MTSFSSSSSSSSPFVVKRSGMFWVFVSVVCFLVSHMAGRLSIMHQQGVLDYPTYFKMTTPKTTTMMRVIEMTMRNMSCRHTVPAAEEEEESCSYNRMSPQRRQQQHVQHAPRFDSSQRSHLTTTTTTTNTITTTAVAETQQSELLLFLEHLVHPILLAHNTSKQVGIVVGGAGACDSGGGDGELQLLQARLVVEEVRKHRSVENITLFVHHHRPTTTTSARDKAGNDCYWESYHDLQQKHSSFETSTTTSTQNVRIEQQHDPVSWFLERFSDDNDDDDDETTTTAEYPTFDVLLFTSAEGASRFLDYKDAVTSLFNSLEDDGVVVLPTDSGTQQQSGCVSPYLHYQHHHHPRFDQWIATLEQVGFESAVTYTTSGADTASGSRTNYLAAMADFDTRAAWFDDEASVNYKIRQRVMPDNDENLPFKYFDASTMQALKFPSRLEEEEEERKNPSRRSSSRQTTLQSPALLQQGAQKTATITRTTTKTRRKHGFDPSVPNVPIESIEVQLSGVGDDAGRGIYTRHDIPKGSFIGLEVCVGTVYLAPAAAELLFDMYEVFPLLSSVKAIAGWVDGYGWGDNHLGLQENGVDASIMTFSNHGCNGTYNMGFHGPFNEQTATFEIGPREYQGYISDDPSFYDPWIDRFMIGKGCLDVISRRDIQKGEEILDNYIVYGGIENDKDWKGTLAELKGFCSGQEVGIVTQYEQSRTSKNLTNWVVDGWVDGLKTGR